MLHNRTTEVCCSLQTVLVCAVLVAACAARAQTPPASTGTNQSWDAVAPPGSTNFTPLPAGGSQADRLNAIRALRAARSNQTAGAVSPLTASQDALSAPPVTLRPAGSTAAGTNPAAPLAAAAVAPVAAAAAVPGPAVVPQANPPVAVPGGAAVPTPGLVIPTAAAVPTVGAAGAPGAAAAGAAATATTNEMDELIPPGMIDFRGADLNQVLTIYSELKNRTLLRPPTLNAAQQIVLQTRGNLTRKEAIQALDTVLGLAGVGVVDVGEKFCEVTPIQQIGQVGAPIGFTTNADRTLPEMGQYVTHVIQLTYTKPTELVPILTPFASAGLQGGILPIDSSGILVLRDLAPNVKRMLEMIKKVDVAVPSEYVSEVIPIKYAMASDIASALNSLSSGGGGTTLGSAAGGGARTTGARSTSGFGRSGFGTTGYPGSTYPGQTQFGQQGTTTPTTTPTPGGSSFTDRLRNIINRASASGEIQVLGQTKIIADERTNSLLIFATRPDMEMIKKIVSQLDVVLAQVLIEAAILQVSLNDSKNLGISYLQTSPSHPGNYFSGIGAINNGTVLNGANFATQVGTNAVSGIPSGFSYLAQLGNDLDVTVTALASSTKARILQRPRIQTSHAVPATLFVGEQRPYPVSSYYGGGAFGGYASIQQLQIGVNIEVTPLINPDGLVVMDIHTKIDSFEGNVTIQNVGDVPITSSKDATAKVAVRDRDTIMLGGLIETDKNSNNSGVPFLKDVPLLGYLFRSSAANESRTELIVLIRPTVLPTPEVAALAARAEKEKMPGVRQSEREMQKEETKRLQRANQQFNQ